MAWLTTKYLFSAGIVVLASELAKRSDRLGGLVTALPIVSILTLIWLHVESQPPLKITNHAWYTFWYVLPTLPMFLVFPTLFRHLGFWTCLLAGATISVICFWLLSSIVKRFGIEMLPN